VKKDKLIKYILFIGLVGILFLPLIQNIRPFYKEKPLKGEFVPALKPIFNNANWFDGSYQIFEEKYRPEHTGFRTLFVRLYNQINYSLLATSPNKNIILGKDDYLFDIKHLNSYLGNDYVGDEEIGLKIVKLEKVLDTLNSLNKKIFVVLAPSKVRYFSEYVPDRYLIQKKEKNNYEELAKQLSKSNVPYIDFSAWFMSQKQKSKYSLMNKFGIHWTKYGEYLAMDSLINYMNRQYNWNLPEVKHHKLTITHTPQFTDRDMIDPLNLKWQNDDLLLAYPDVYIDSTKSYKKGPRLLVVGDSFYWGMYTWGMGRDVFDRGEYWYYNRIIYPELYENGKIVQRDPMFIDMNNIIDKFDIIIIFQTEQNLYDLGFRFIERLYASYSPDINQEEKKIRIEYYIDLIKGNPEWFYSVKEKAKKWNKPLEEALRIDATYMLEQEQDAKIKKEIKAMEIEKKKNR